ncbi:UNVERIFIED_CONTAM: hypothetical protein NCL1_12296 [Trichonephila clavipes]
MDIYYKWGSQHITEGVRCFPCEMGIHYRRKSETSFPEENTSMPYSGFKPEPTRLQAEGHIYHTGWAAKSCNITCTWCDGLGAIGYTTRTSLVRVDGKLNANLYISDILCPVIGPYRRGLSNALYQQDNARPYVARLNCNLHLHVYQIRHPLKTSGLRLLRDWPTIPLQLILEVCQRFEVEWKELPISVIQSQFDSMPRRIRAVLANRILIPAVYYVSLLCPKAKNNWETVEKKELNETEKLETSHT